MRPDAAAGMVVVVVVAALAVADSAAAAAARISVAAVPVLGAVDLISVAVARGLAVAISVGLASAGLISAAGAPSAAAGRLCRTPTRGVVAAETAIMPGAAGPGDTPIATGGPIAPLLSMGRRIVPLLCVTVAPATSNPVLCTIG
jgi:hypothetical protein